MIFLPFAEEFRDLEAIFTAAGVTADVDSAIESLTTEEKDAAKLLVKNLTIEFNSRNFENPAL